MKTIEEIALEREESVKKGKMSRERIYEDVRIYLTINDEEECFNSYSLGGFPMIPQEMEDCIETQAEAVVPANIVGLDIYSDAISEEAKPYFVKALFNTLMVRKNKNLWKLKQNMKMVLTFGILGVVTILLSCYAYMRGVLPEAICEIIDILAWVFLWSCAEGVIFERQEMLEEKKIIDCFNGCEVSFHPKRHLR